MSKEISNHNVTIIEPYEIKRVRADNSKFFENYRKIKENTINFWQY